MATVIFAQGLSVSPATADLGEFPSWERRESLFSIRNTLERPVKLLRVRSSCSCTVVDFNSCMLEPGQETSVTVSIPQNSLSGEFTRTVYVETDAPGQEFLKLAVSGTAVPAVEVFPKCDVYLGRLDAGQPQTFLFRLVPASPDMSLKLLPADDGDGPADVVLLPDNDGSFNLFGMFFHLIFC